MTKSIKPSVFVFKSESTGIELQIKELTTGQICDLLPILKEIKNSLPSEGEINLFDIISENANAVTQAVAVAANTSVDAIRELPIDETIQLAGIVYNQNKDFFVQRVLPAMAARKSR